MAERVVDLWRLKEDASRLYEIYLIRLQMNRLHERVVVASRQIRRYAARGPGVKEGLFTFSFEIDSLCDLKEYKAAWRQLRLREEIVFGKRLDVEQHEWSATDESELMHSYAPLLFFLRRYREGCSLLEISLAFWFRSRKVPSYDLLFHVYNADEEPRHRCRVTLSHFYSRLGLELCNWRHWEAFVDGFHPRLFRLSGIRRDELLGDSGRLASFFDRLMDVQSERIISGVTSGESDLVESATKVRKRQMTLKKKLDEFEERIEPTIKRRDTKLQEFFPELQGLMR